MGYVMKWQTPDEIIYEGTSYKQIVAKMGQREKIKLGSQEQYRKQVARRIKEMYDYDIATGSDKAFLFSLLKNGLIERL